MKKLLIAAAVVCAAMFVNAAAIGWSAANIANFKGDAYMFFVEGQNGASITDVTAALNNGNVTTAPAGSKSAASMAFGQGVVNASAQATQAATVAGAPRLDAGTYTGFFVLFDNANLASAAKYVVISDIATLTQTFNENKATVTFGAGNVAGIVNTPGNWKTLPTPEPTSGLLMLIGCAVLGLRRKQK